MHQLKDERGSLQTEHKLALTRAEVQASKVPIQEQQLAQRPT